MYNKCTINVHLRCAPAVGICPHFRGAGRRKEEGGRREKGGMRKEDGEGRREDGSREYMGDGRGER